MKNETVFALEVEKNTLEAIYEALGNGEMDIDYRFALFGVISRLNSVINEIAGSNEEEENTIVEDIVE